MLRHLGEGGFAVEGRKNGAADQGCAAKASQNGAAEPLHGDAAAVDHGGFGAVHRQWRFVAEIDRRGTSVLSACRPVMQAVVPNWSVQRAESAALKLVRSIRRPRGETQVIAENADLRNMPVRADNFCAQNVGGMWLKCGVRPR